MNKTSFPTLFVLCIAALVVGLSGVAMSQADTFKIDYYANADARLVGGQAPGAPDATVRIDNPGTANYADLCSMIYVFTGDQQMVECCGCRNTHNDLRTISVQRNLTSNPLTAVPPNRGALKIVSAAVNGAFCDPSSNVTPTSTLRAWATHVQNKVGTAWPITETAFSDAPLSATELANLQAQCAFINILGSGHGVCTCGAETN